MKIFFFGISSRFSFLPAVGMAKEEFRVYNSMTQQKEIFTPKEPGKVGMYVCGITAYDFSHIGHARAAVNFDVLYRFADFCIRISIRK